MKSAKPPKTKALSTLPVYVLKDRVVQRLTQAEQALGVAVGIDQVKLVMDVAAAQEVFARRQQLGEAVIGQAHTIKIRALAKLGELLKEMEKAAGRAGPGRGKAGSHAGQAFNDSPTLKELGVSRKVASVAQQLAGLPPDTREAIAQREQTLGEVKRERKAAEIKRAVSLPDAKFRVLYADPPWSYGDKADAGSVQSGGAETHYPSMTISQLCNMPVAEMCEPNAVLFLWVTSPLLFEAAPVIKAWGFTYKASFVWDKVKHNMGHYNSVRHEFLLICTRGSCTPDVPQLFDSVQSIERTVHSAKPAEFRRIIDTIYPHGKRLELFARGSADGWDVFGHQAEEAAS